MSSRRADRYRYSAKIPGPKPPKHWKASPPRARFVAYMPWWDSWQPRTDLPYLVSELCTLLTRDNSLDAACSALAHRFNAVNRTVIDEYVHVQPICLRRVS